MDTSEWNKTYSLFEIFILKMNSIKTKKNIFIELFGIDIINHDIHFLINLFNEKKINIEESIKILDELLDFDNIVYDIGEKNGVEINNEKGDVVLFGFGRIGRLLLRIITKRNRTLKVKLIIIKDEMSLQRRLSLLEKDSVHGKFLCDIKIINKNEIIINGHKINIIYTDNPFTINYDKLNIKNAILLDSTGIFKNKNILSKFITENYISKVIVTAPTNDTEMIIAEVNYNFITNNEHIYSAGSCTTNAVVPVLKIVNDKYGIDHVHIETVHSYTNDQNLVDNYHNKNRRGRAATLNMIITETGSSTSIIKIIPDLKDKMSGSAIRVPTPNVSLAILIMTLKQNITLEEILDFFKNIKSKIIYFSYDKELVSSDLNGNSYSAIIDCPSTIVNKNHLNLYVWYDNEYGYSYQVVRLAEKISNML